MRILKRVTAFILTFIMLLQEIAYGDIVLYAYGNVLVNNTYNAANHLICYNGKEISYDADGNMLETPIEGELTSLKYDCRNRLTRAGETTYKYDAENIRIQSVSEEKTIEYVTDTTGQLSKVLVEYEYSITGKEESADEEVTQSELKDTTIYVYGNGLISQENSAGYYTYHYNNLGSTTRITDEFRNNVETFTYGTYGELLNGTTSNTHYMYNGQYGVSTENNGLYYMRQRYYNPEIKRFINQDVVTGSIDNSQSLNRYCYVQGNPVSLIDPFGLFPLSPNSLDHTIFGLLGMLPVVGIVADAIDCGLYIKEGDTANAIMSSISITPIIGQFAAAKLIPKIKKAKKTGEVVQKTTNAIEESATFLSRTTDVSKYGDEAIEIVAKGADDALEMAVDATTDIAKGTDLTTEVVRKTDLENGITGQIADAVGDVSKGGSGSVIYGELDSLGRTTGIEATITLDMIGTGSSAQSSIKPAGFGGQAQGHARGHLLGKQLGGSGKDPRNLVTIYQNPVNHPVMSSIESSVRNAVEGGQIVSYKVTPIYEGNNLIPRGITIQVQGSGGLNIYQTILNRK